MGSVPHSPEYLEGDRQRENDKKYEGIVTLDQAVPVRDFNELKDSECGPSGAAHDAVSLSAAPEVQEAVSTCGEGVDGSDEQVWNTEPDCNGNEEDTPTRALRQNAIHDLRCARVAGQRGRRA
ncbi:MAG TPA: hypothetical protein VMW80_09040 [Candidatus Dormibacteraeota bacterium]|nr:hypothetical protein [Candidatus Dormibacteraeota bacterium]